VACPKYLERAAMKLVQDCSICITSAVSTRVTGLLVCASIIIKIEITPCILPWI